MYSFRPPCPAWRPPPLTACRALRSAAAPSPAPTAPHRRAGAEPSCWARRPAGGAAAPHGGSRRRGSLRRRRRRRPLCIVRPRRCRRRERGSARGRAAPPSLSAAAQPGHRRARPLRAACKEVSAGRAARSGAVRARGASPRVRGEGRSRGGGGVGRNLSGKMRRGAHGARCTRGQACRGAAASAVAEAALRRGDGTCQDPAGKQNPLEVRDRRWWIITYIEMSNIPAGAGREGARSGAGAERRVVRRAGGHPCPGAQPRGTALGSGRAPKAFVGGRYGRPPPTHRGGWYSAWNTWRFWLFTRSERGLILSLRQSESAAEKRQRRQRWFGTFLYIQYLYSFLLQVFFYRQ